MSPTGRPVNPRGFIYYFWVATNPLDSGVLQVLNQTSQAYTIASIRHRLRSVTDLATLDFTLRHGDTPSTGGGTEIITSGMTAAATEVVESTFDSADIPVDDAVWIDFGTLTNSPAQEILIQVVVA